jgi:hypothetical protein
METSFVYYARQNPFVKRNVTPTLRNINELHYPRPSFQIQPRDSDGQPESLRSGTSRIHVMNSRSPRPYGLMRVSTDYHRETRRGRVKIQFFQIVKHIDQSRSFLSNRCDR